MYILCIVEDSSLINFKEIFKYPKYPKLPGFTRVQNFWYPKYPVLKNTRYPRGIVATKSDTISPFIF